MKYKFGTLSLVLSLVLMAISVGLCLANAPFNPIGAVCDLLAYAIYDFLALRFKVWKFTHFLAVLWAGTDVVVDGVRLTMRVSESLRAACFMIWPCAASTLVFAIACLVDSDTGRKDEPNVLPE